MKGKISQWNDEKGFGFIVSEDNTEKVFFHISSLKSSIRRPYIGDSVVYEPTLDSQNRLRAKAVVIEGAAAQSSTNRKSQSIQVAPPKKSVLDYLLIAVLLVSLGKTGFVFHQTSQVEKAAPYAVLAIIAALTLTRQKKPKEKQFNCSCCKAVVDFDTRTIQAWNRGALKLYCGSCHQRWLLENPAQTSGHSVTRGGGCLGILCLLVVLPIAAGISIYNWIA